MIDRTFQIKDSITTYKTISVEFSTIKQDIKEILGLRFTKNFSLEIGNMLLGTSVINILFPFSNLIE